jgi:hypothetical protein
VGGYALQGRGSTPGTSTGGSELDQQQQPQDEGEDEDSDLLPGGTLVVCPTSVLHQWRREISEKVNTKTTSFTTHVYHGKVGASQQWQMLMGQDNGITATTLQQRLR